MKKKRQPAKLDRCVKAVKKRGGAASAFAVCKSALKKKKNAPKRKAAKKKGKRNPAAVADNVYEEFHGRLSEELVTVKTTFHFHKHLAALGDLEALDLKSPSGRRVLLEFSKGPILCVNEKKNQLFVEGPVKVNLSAFGVNPDHEIVTLGECIEVVYFTTKDHLGPKDGGTGPYGHKFGTTNKDGRHVKVKFAQPPDVIYRTRDQVLEFSGGSYFVRAEGIDQ